MKLSNIRYLLVISVFLLNFAYVNGIDTEIFGPNHVATGTNKLHNVNMWIGTSFTANISDVHDYGQTIPSIGLPFAHTPWTPQTRFSENKCESPYYYFDSYWRGMRRTHWMSGSCVIDYGSATILPSISLNLNSAMSYYDLKHENEQMNPSVYEYILDESNLKIQASSLNSAGYFKMTKIQSSVTDDVDSMIYLLFMASDTMYNQSSISILKDNQTVFIDSPVHRWYQAKGTSAGFSGHHVFKTNRPASRIGIIDGYSSTIKDDAYYGKASVNGPAVGYLQFDMKDGDLFVSTACSFVSNKNAFSNMMNEISYHSHDNNNNFDMMINSVQSEWESKLNLIDVSYDYLHNNHVKKKFRRLNLDPNDNISTKNKHKSQKEIMSKYNKNSKNNNDNKGNKDQTIIFYTALWHSLLLPRIISDNNGDYLSFNMNSTTFSRPIENTNNLHQPFQFNHYFDDFSMWDIFRAQIPLFSLINLSPSNNNIIRDMIASLTKKAMEGGWMPIFPAWNSYTGEMIGDHCAVFITDIILKENHILWNDPIIPFAIEKIIQNAMKIPSEEDYNEGKGRRALNSYMKYGFIPIEDHILQSPHPNQQVSRTLEYAYDDYVVAQLLSYALEKLNNSQFDKNENNYYYDNKNEIFDYFNNNDNDSNNNYDYNNNKYNSLMRSLRYLHYDKNYKNKNDPIFDSYFSSIKELIILLSNRSLNYRNLINKNMDNFVNPKHINNEWVYNNPSDFNPLNYYNWITETTVWQYTWFIPHNVEDMISILGGDDLFINKVDEFFDNNYYNHGNEPDHHVAYLYSYSKQNSWKQQKRIHEIIYSQYGSDEKGLPGNEDAGQMSAWYVMSSIGLYKICPGCGGLDEYVLILPLFDMITIQLPVKPNNNNNNKLFIKVHNRVDYQHDYYIQTVIINGIEYDCNFVSYKQVMEGGRWDFYASHQPNKSRGSFGRSCLIDEILSQ
eukprot:gene11485-15382_t